jgi:hypothetical protein
MKEAGSSIPPGGNERMNERLARVICGVLFAALFFFLGPSPSLSLDNVGTTAAQFMKIEVGARATGMGGNFVALADDPTALYYNPAGITIFTGPSFSASHIEWFADIVHDFVGFAVPVGAGAMGVSVTALNTGRMEQTTVEQPEGTGIFFDYSGTAIGVSYGRQMTDRFSFGITGKYIAEKAFNESAQTVAVDLGTLLDVGYRSIRIGMSITNFGGRMKLSGRDLLTGIDTNTDGTSETEASLGTDSWSLPLVFRVGTAVDLVGADAFLTGSELHRLTLTVDGLHPNDNVERLGFGVEYGLRETAYLRAGYKANHDSEDIAFGGGVRFTIAGVDLGIDYSYSDLGDLENVQRASITLLF